MCIRQLPILVSTTDFDFYFDRILGFLKFCTPNGAESFPDVCLHMRRV